MKNCVSILLNDFAQVKGQRSLVGCCLWRKESDMTEQLRIAHVQAPGGKETGCQSC